MKKKHIIFVFILTLIIGTIGVVHTRKYSIQAANESTKMQAQTVSTENNQKPTKKLSDLSEAFSCILLNGSAKMHSGYPIDESFLLWITARYGEDTVKGLAQAALDGCEDNQIWYTLTGNSIHVLWLEYCRDLNYSSYLLEKTTWKEANTEEEIVIDVIGDINLDESWHTMLAANQSENGISDYISPEIISELQSADITWINNEFTFSTRGKPLTGKAYTFRADPSMVEKLELFGTDIASLANNHAYDYGEEALLDTMQTLKDAGIAYVGAGKNIEEASKPQYFIINGQKLAFVAATQIEKSTLYTKEATENSAGVLRTANPARVVEEIKKAKAVSDYVIVYVHWGTEGMLYAQEDQKALAESYVQAGADAIIGGHAHRMQGVYYVSGVPVVSSMGNFWFSTGALYTTIAQLKISSEGKIQLVLMPCVQQDMKTYMLTEPEDVSKFYEYVADLSENIVIDENGVFSIQSIAKEGSFSYKSGSHYDRRTGAYDLLERQIDIVGNLTN